MKKFLYTISALALMTSCTEDFKDWADPVTVEQPAVVSFADGGVASVGTINLNEVFAQEQDSVQVCTITAPTASDAVYTPYYILNIVNANNETTSFALDEQGRLAAADLQAYVAANYGRNPNTVNSMTATVEMWLTDGTTAVKQATSEAFVIKAIPEAPTIDEGGYYIVGNVDGWTCTKVDAMHLVNNGGDVYENPVFSLLMPAVDGITTYEIKFIPASAFNADGSIANWDIALSALKDVDEEAYEGRFSYSNEGGNIKFAAKENSLYYNIKLNLLEGTYTIQPVNFAEFIYEIGNGTGWSTSEALYCANSDGKYQGYYYLNGGFKFKPNADNWEGDWGQDPNGAAGTLVQDGEQDCNTEAGFYQIDVDLAAMTYALTKVESISIIGTVNGNWDTDTDLTFNTTDKCWEVTTALNAGAMKFRMNHDWTISWGGANGDATAFNNLTQNNGKDLTLAEAGTYKVQLYITYEGNNKVVLTKQ